MSTLPAADPDNFLEAEEHIVARLKDALSALRPGVHVLTAAELAGLAEGTQPTPAVHVLWNGFQVLETSHDGTAARLDHTWLVAAAVRNVRDVKSGAAARAEAGKLVMRAGRALMGFRPPANVCGPLRLVSGPGAGYSKAGFLYLPLAFKVESVFQ